MKKILFVCYGNAFRSQMAEAFFNRHNKNPEFIAASAGTNPFGRIPSATIELMKEKSIDLAGHSSKRLTKEMTEEAHKIYILYNDDFTDLPQEKVIMMPVADPIDEDLNTQRKIRDEIEAKIKKIITGLK